MRPKDNPFSAHRLDRISYLFNDTNWTQVLDQLTKLNYRAAIIGVRGSGKTTFLSCLDQQLQQQGFKTLTLFVNTELRQLTQAQWHNIRQASTSTIILFDGADIISPWSWWRFRRESRHLKGVVGTSHRRRLLPPLIYTQPNADLLLRVLKVLEIPVTAELQQHGEKLLKKHRGNIRDVLREFYWLYIDR